MRRLFWVPERHHRRLRDISGSKSFRFSIPKKGRTVKEEEEGNWISQFPIGSSAAVSLHPAVFNPPASISLSHSTWRSNFSKLHSLFHVSVNLPSSSDAVENDFGDTLRQVLGQEWFPFTECLPVKSHADGGRHDNRNALNTKCARD